MLILARALLVLMLMVPAAPAAARTFNLIGRLTVGGVAGFDNGFAVVGAATSVTSLGGGAAQIPAGLFPATFSGPISPQATGINRFSVMGGGLPAGTLDAAAATNVLPLQGTLSVFAGLNPAGSMGLAPIGAGGSGMGLIISVFAATLIAQPWQLGVHTATGTGTLAGTVMLTGFDLRTALGLGMVQFVAPHSTVIPGIPVTIASGSTLQLVYVPVAEPGSMVMLGLTVLAAASRGRRIRGARAS